MTKRVPPSTPDATGYLAMFGVSLLVAPTVVVVCFAAYDLAIDPVLIAAVIIYWPFVAIYQLFFAVPTALVGLPLIHLCTRWIPRQWPQVVVAGLVPAALLLAYTYALGGLEDFSGSPILAVAVVAGSIGSAAGRAAVIPRVRRRSRPPAPFGTPARPIPPPPRALPPA